MVLTCMDRGIKYWYNKRLWQEGMQGLKQA